MSATKHTPEPHDYGEPWKVGPPTKTRDGELAVDHSKYMERARACVNGCAGLNPEAVPALVEAAEKALREFDRITVFDANRSRFADLRAALAAVKGVAR